MPSKLYKANVIAATAHALVSVAICSAYDLWQPHPVGYIYPAAGALTSGLWAVHCWFLGIASGSTSKASFRWASIPLSISLIAVLACLVRYEQELPRQYKMLEWIHENAA
jgi:hypothetical protein